MLGLKMATDPRWINVAEKNIQEILTDHAFCEQKAASNAISIIVQYPMFPDLVSAMTAICQEEMQHFNLVHEKIIALGLTLGFERKDPYVNDLSEFLRRNKTNSSKEGLFVNKMLLAAMIEARSCERFKILSENLPQEDLRLFYRSLMESEARHYTTFLGFAKKYAKDINVDKCWDELLIFEAELMDKYGKFQTIHG
ncbi:MAG: tRNA-(ms[2]io[6]A)-hydroxylase [Flavobacteriales bacterium]